jgi:hypothetical protein
MYRPDQSRGPTKCWTVGASFPSRTRAAPLYLTIPLYYMSPMSREFILAVCDQCHQVHLTRGLVQLDGEPHQACPDCTGSTQPLPEPTTPTLRRLFEIEAAARELVAAGPADGGDPYLKNRQAPAGARRLAWKQLASLLDDGPRVGGAVQPSVARAHAAHALVVGRR